MSFDLSQELPRAVNTNALSGAAVVRLFNKVGETVNKITYKMDENDPVSDVDYKIYYHLLICIFCVLFLLFSGLMRKLPR